MKSLILTLVLMFGLFATPAFTAAMQPSVNDATFQSALSGETIDLGTSGDIAFIADSYELSEGRSVSEEYIWFTYGWSNFEIVIVEGDIDVAEYYDLTMGNMIEFYEVFEVIDENVAVDSAWFLANASYQGTEMVVFYEYQSDALGEFDLLVMQFAPADAFATDMDYVQQEVTIGNMPILPNTNPQDVDALLSGGSTGSGADDTTPESASGPGSGVSERMGRVGDPVNGDDSTPEPTETTGTSRVTRTTRTTRSSGTDEATATATSSTSRRSTRTTRTTGSTQPTTTADNTWESMGLVSDTEWISPHFQTTVTWDGAMWAFPVENENAIYLDDDGEADMIFLESVDGLGMADVRISEAGTLIPSEYADFWSSNLLTGPNNEEVVVLDIAETRNAAAVVYQFVDENNEPTTVILTVWYMDDGTVISTRIVTAPENASALYGQLIDGVQVNGEPVGNLVIYSPEDIAGFIGN